MTAPEIARLKAEILHKGKLQDFEQILNRIIDCITSSPECCLSCSDVDRNSKITFIENRCWIQIGFKNQREEKQEVLWDILHEYGHYLSGKPPIENGPGLAREMEAWDNALIEIQTHFHELLPFLDSFTRYREVCLNTYLTRPI